MTVSDPGGSGISGSGGYFLQESATPVPTAASAGWKPAPVWTLSAGDGTKTLYLWVKDNNGSVSTAYASATIVIDTIAPTAVLTIPATSPTTTVSPITVTGTDTGGSGIVAYAVVDGTTAPSYGDPNWIIGSSPTSVVINDGSGAHTVTAFTRDAAGNVSVVNSGNSKTVTLP